MIKFKLHILLFLGFIGMIPFAFAEEQYKFTNWDGVDLPVFVAKPNKVNKATRLVVVMHGRKRNAEEYRDQWIEAAKDLNLLVVVPEFSEQNFPQVWGFNYGNVKTAASEPIEKKLHAFSAIGPLATEALKKYKLKSNNWGIYGHGAGAHFVHRYLLHHPEANHTLAIAANLGWYLSMTDQAWPFGLTNSGIEAGKLKQAFSKYFLLMLGKADTSTKPNSPYVKEHWDTITLQGEHRLARGRNFFKSAVIKSKEFDQFFKWGMVEVPTTKGHSNTEQMVPYAAEMFYARLR
jgi:poly(3-hydroxybutyrate) depolymerase